MKRPFRQLLAVLAVAASLLLNAGAESALVFQTDFGLKDGAVSAMKGVAFGVSPTLKQFDLTHEIPAYNVWEAAFRLKQTTPTAGAKRASAPAGSRTVWPSVRLPCPCSCRSRMGSASRAI